MRFALCSGPFLPMRHLAASLTVSTVGLAALGAVDGAAQSPSAPSSGAPRTFTTTNRLVFGTPSDLTASIVFADVDGDGDLDALLANGRHWAQVNEVYINNGDGQFTFG